MPQKEVQSFITTIERAAPEITQTKEFGDCVEPTVKMCISQTANEMARKQNSISFCEKLEDEDAIYSCKYGVIISKFATDNQINSCDALNEEYRTECRIASITLSATLEDAPKDCEQIRNELSEINKGNAEKRVDQCKFSIIMKRTTLKNSDCSELSWKSEREACVSMVEIQNKQR